MTCSIPLELLNNKLFNNLFTGLTYIDKTKIITITYERKIEKIKYEKYNPETNTYHDVFTDDRTSQFIFNINVNYSSSPIIISCDDSRERDYSKLTSYRWIPAKSTENSNKIIWNFIINGSLNDYSYYLEKFGQILGYIVNNNIVLLEEKILKYNKCPINLTEYDSSSNILLLYPCLHSISSTAYETGLVNKCPICRININDTQLLTFIEFNKILENN
jgi:hypothetical protein